MHYGLAQFYTKDKFFKARLVDCTHYRNNPGIYSGALTLEVNMLKYFMKFKLGWWILHIIAVAGTFYLGHMVRFKF